MICSKCGKKCDAKSPLSRMGVMMETEYKAVSMCCEADIINKDNIQGCNHYDMSSGSSIENQVCGHPRASIGRYFNKEDNNCNVCKNNDFTIGYYIVKILDENHYHGAPRYFENKEPLKICNICGNVQIDIKIK